MSAPVPPPETSRRRLRLHGAAVVLAALSLIALSLAPRRPPATGQDAPTVAIAGQLGGEGTSLAIAPDERLHVGAGPRVSALEMGVGPDATVTLTRSWTSPTLAGVVRDVAPAGRRTVAVGDAFGVALLDAAGGAWREVARGFDGRTVLVDEAAETALVVARDGALRAISLAGDADALLMPVEVGAVAGSAVAGPDQVEDVTAAALVGDIWWLAVTSRAELPVAWLVPIDVRDPAAPIVGDPHALEAVALDLAATADGRLLALEDRVGLIVWDVSDRASPLRAGQLPLQTLGAPAWSVAGDPSDAGVAWVVGSSINAVEGSGLLWRVDVSDPAAPAVVGAVETDFPGGVVRVDEAGRAWLLHPQHAVTTADALDLAAPQTDPLPRMPSIWAAPGGVRAAALSPEGRLAVATGLGGVWLLDPALDPDGEAAFRVVGSHRVIGEVDALTWGWSGQGEEADVLWLTTQRPGALQALRVPRTAGGDFKELGRMEGMGTPVSLALDAVRELLYVADVERGLWFVTADAAAPKLQSRFREATEIWDVLPDGDRAWAAAGDRGVLWLDTVDQRSVSALFWLNTPGTAFGLAPFGTHVLVADLEAGVQTARTLRGQPMPGGSLSLGQVTDVAAVGGYGYAAVVGMGVFEFDPRDIRVLAPRRAVRVAGLVRRLEPEPTPQVQGLDAGPARLLAAAGEGGLYWLEVDPPESPATATPRPTASPSPTPSAPVFVPWAGTGREEPPFVLAEQGALSSDALGGRDLVAVAMRGARAVIGLTRVRGGERAGLALVALDESPPRLVGRYEGLPVAPRDLAFDGEKVTVAAWTDGLRLLSLDELGRFEPLGGLTTTLRVAHVAAPLEAGGRLHLGGTRLDPGPRAGLMSVDAGDPRAIETLAGTRLPDISALARADGALYVLDYTAGLRVLDARDPLTFTARAVLPLPGAADVAADGRGRIVLATRTDGGDIEGGLVVLDATDPLSPTVAGRWARGGGEPGSRARFVALSEVEAPEDDPAASPRTVAWLAGDRDLHVIDVSDPAAPVLLAARRLAAGGVVGLAAEGRRAVLLHRQRGAVVITLE